MVIAVTVHVTCAMPWLKPADGVQVALYVGKP